MAGRSPTRGLTLTIETVGMVVGQFGGGVGVDSLIVWVAARFAGDRGEFSLLVSHTVSGPAKPKILALAPDWVFSLRSGLVRAAFFGFEAGP